MFYPDVLISAAAELSRQVEKLRFSAPVAYTYNPLSYAWKAHESYLRKFGAGPKRVLFLGMNPGPFGMVQTGIPFGEIVAVRDWLGIEAEVEQPAHQHPRRPISGFACLRSEVSGRRLWGLFKERFGTADLFFKEHLVLNYCPLAFVENSGRNRTPDKLFPKERLRLFEACDAHLRAVVLAIRPEWVIGVGEFAVKRARFVLGRTVDVGGILHPSPACPLANRAWDQTVTRQLIQMKVWSH